MFLHEHIHLEILSKGSVQPIFLFMAVKFWVLCALFSAGNVYGDLNYYCFLFSLLNCVVV